MPSRRLLLAAVVAALLPACLAAQPIDRAAVKPGLVFTASGQVPPSVSRLEPGVGLTLDGAPAVAHWVGTINILQAGRYRFDATVAGSATVTVGGKVVFQAERPTAEFVVGVESELPAGINRSK